MKKNKRNTLLKGRRSINWEQRRYEIAKEMLPQLSKWTNFDGMRLNCFEVASTAICYADALIIELKKDR